MCPSEDARHAPVMVDEVRRPHGEGKGLAEIPARAFARWLALRSGTAALVARRHRRVKWSWALTRAHCPAALRAPIRCPSSRSS
jgi:hypothetical protein